MSIFQKKLCFLIIVLIVSLMVVGCQPSVRPISPTAITTFTSTSTSGLPSATTTPGSVAITSPVVEVRSTQDVATSTPIPSITGTPLTPTAFPTLTEPQEKKLVVDLLHNNAGCKLPCWWGFVPGITTWDTVQEYLKSLGKRIRTDTGLDGIMFWTDPYYFEENDFRIGTTYIVRDGVIQTIIVFSGIYEGDFMIVDDPDYLQYMKSYTLSGILSAYGEPEEIRVVAYSESGGGVSPDYSTMLFYPDRGLMVRYEGIWYEDGDIYQLCLDKAFITLWLWSPQANLSLADVYLSDANGLFVDQYKQILGLHRPLEEVAGMDVHTFYETFKNKASDACLETPVELWK